MNIVTKTFFTYDDNINLSFAATKNFFKFKCIKCRCKLQCSIEFSTIMKHKKKISIYEI